MAFRHLSALPRVRPEVCLTREQAKFESSSHPDRHALTNEEHVRIVGEVLLVAGNGGQGTATMGYPGTESGPGLATGAGKILMAWRGAGTDQDIWFTQAALGPIVAGLGSAEWSSQAHVPVFATADKPVVASFQGNTYLASRGIDGDRGIYTTFV
jgi:hypothetical protein